MFDLLGMGNMGSYESRKVGRWDGEDKMVSTCAVTDGAMPFETAFEHPDYNDGNMVIVEAYETREAAVKGHEKWVKVMTEGPLPDKLVDCCNAKIAQLATALGCEGSFPRVVKVIKDNSANNTFSGTKTIESKTKKKVKSKAKTKTKMKKKAK